MNFDTIKEKVGPLPIWVWGVIVGAIGLLIYYIYRSGKQKVNNTVVPQPGYSSAADSLGLVTPSGSVGSVITQTVETNQSWLQKAVSYLSGQGYNSADAAVWVQSYLTGIPIVGSKGKTAIQDALDRFGTPPDTSFGVPTFVADAPVETRLVYYNPTAHTWYLIGKGYYEETQDQGTANTWARIYGNVTPDRFISASQLATIKGANA